MRKFHLAAVAVLGLWSEPVAAAPAAELCVEVSVQGRPLPFGFLSLLPDTPRPGASERSFVRLREGRVCMKGLEPGSYILQVAPLSSNNPLFLAGKGFPGIEMGYPVRLSPGAADTVRLAYAPPRDRPRRLEVGVVFPEGAVPDLDHDPILIVLGFGGSGSGGYVCHWLTGRGTGGRVSFTLEAPLGELEEVRLGSSHWAVTSTDPKMSGQGGAQRTLGEQRRIEIRVARGSRLGGTVRLPDGKPFHPHKGGAGERLFSVFLETEETHYTRQVYVAEDGTYEFPAVAAGWHGLYPLGSGPGYDRVAPMSIWQFMDGPKTVDIALKPPALVRVEPPGIPRDETDTPLERRLAGVPAGLGMPAYASRLINRSPVISLLQSSSGAWMDLERDNTALAGDTGFRVPPGEYDFYLYERSPQPYLSVRLLRAPVRLAAPESSTATLRMPGPYEVGTASLTGVIRLKSRLVPEDLTKPVGHIIDLHTRIVPRVNLYRGETWVGTAFGALTPKVAEAMDRGDFEGLKSLLATGRWDFVMTRLAPGRYRAVIAAPGLPDREFPVVLTAGATTHLDVDLDN